MAKRKATRKEVRQAEARRFTSYVEAMLADAHRAALEAAKDFLKTAKRTPDGHAEDLCGRATVVVYKPSYRLRETLKTLGEVQRDYDGAWWISDFSHNVPSQSVTAHERACAAARDVFVRAFPGEGQFSSKTFIN